MAAQSFTDGCIIIYLTNPPLMDNNVLSIFDNAATNLLVNESLCKCTSISLDKLLEVELLGQKICAFKIFD